MPRDLAYAVPAQYLRCAHLNSTHVLVVLEPMRAELASGFACGCGGRRIDHARPLGGQARHRGDESTTVDPCQLRLYSHRDGGVRLLGYGTGVGYVDIFVEWGKNQLSSESLRDSGNLFSSI